jgi:hypothetical protein
MILQLLLGCCVLLAASTSNAATENGALKMEVITAYNLVVDSNVTSASTNGPTAAHLGIRVTNTGATALTNVVVNIGNKTANTPGVFPSRTIPEADPLPFAGTFALNMPGGADDAVRVIPSISAGETVTAYFFITYPAKDASNRSLAGAASKVSDDLWLNYDMWVTADGSLDVDQTTKVTMRNEISAMANKVSPNSTAKVPQEYLDAFNLTLGLAAVKNWGPDSLDLTLSQQAVVLTTMVVGRRIRCKDARVRDFDWNNLLSSERRKFKSWILKLDSETFSR